MSRKFILNSLYFSESKNTEVIAESDSKGEYIFISRESEISVDKGDEFIYSTGTNAHFEKKGTVIKKKKIRTLPISDKDRKANESRKQKGLKPLGREYEWELDTRIDKELKRPHYYSDLVYSLLFVNNYSKPKEHIEQKIRLIPDFDFETIEMGLVYLSRTAFGKLFNCLPFENKLHIRQLIFDYNREKNITAKDYIQNTKQIITYVNEQFMAQGVFLKHSKDMLVRRFGDKAKAFSIYDERYKADKNIYNQATLFEPLLEKNTIQILSDLITAVRQNRKDEERFEKAFNTRRLPIAN